MRPPQVQETLAGSQAPSLRRHREGCPSPRDRGRHAGTSGTSRSQSTTACRLSSSACLSIDSGSFTRPLRSELEDDITGAQGYSGAKPAMQNSPGNGCGAASHLVILYGSTFVTGRAGAPDVLWFRWLVRLSNGFALYPAGSVRVTCVLGLGGLLAATQPNENSVSKPDLVYPAGLLVRGGGSGH